MKNKFMVVAFTSLIGVQLQAQNTISPKTTFTPPTVPVKVVTVTAVTIVKDSVTSISHNGGTNTSTYHFKGIINYTGKGSISYKWAIVNTNSANIPPVYKTGSIITTGSGIENVFVDMGNGGNGFTKIALVILSPTQITSNSITY